MDSHVGVLTNVVTSELYIYIALLKFWLELSRYINDFV